MAPSREVRERARIRRPLMVADYVSGMSTFAVARKHCVSVALVCQALKRFGVPCRPNTVANRRHALNEAAFETNTPEANYWLGFLLADGCVYSRKHGDEHDCMIVRLAVKDIGHLEKLKAFLGSSANVFTVKPSTATYNGKAINSGISCVFQAYSTRLTQGLLANGIFPRKTHTADVAEHLEDSVDFWRGVIDGDGCLTWNRASFIVGLVGTRMVCESFARFVAKRLGVKVRAVHKKGGPSLCQIHYASNGARRLATLLYNGGVSLDRKQAIADQMKATPPPKCGRPNTFSATLIETLTMPMLLGYYSRFGTWREVKQHLGIPQKPMEELRRKLFPEGHHCYPHTLPRGAERRHPSDINAFSKSFLLARRKALGGWRKVALETGLNRSSMRRFVKS